MPAAALVVPPPPKPITRLPIILLAVSHQAPGAGPGPTREIPTLQPVMVLFSKTLKACAPFAPAAETDVVCADVRAFTISIPRAPSAAGPEPPPLKVLSFTAQLRTTLCRQPFALSALKKPNPNSIVPGDVVLVSTSSMPSITT